MTTLLSPGVVGRRSRDALIRARGRMIFAVPEAWRGRAAATLPARLVPPEMRPDSLVDGGAFVAVHYVPRMGSVLNGDEATT